MLIASLALRDLLRDRFFLVCNVAVMVGILVPLLVLFGVKNGVYSALIGEMLADPANLQIDTAGNVTLTPDQIAPLYDWEDVTFVTPKVRGQFDFVNTRKTGGRRITAALLVPSGAGDPTLTPEARVEDAQVAVSAQLAAALEISAGDAMQIITQAEDRPRQLLLDARVSAVLPEQAVSGRAVLAPFETLDLVEAFYDSYSLPEHGIEGSKDLADRAQAFEGVRLFARALEDLAVVQARTERTLDVATVANTRAVTSVLQLGRNLNLALGLTTILAAIGLGGALVLGFWSDVARKRAVLAGIALLGVPGRQLALFPVVQAALTAVIGLTLSFAIYGIAARIAAGMFGQGLPDGARLAIISVSQAVVICIAVLALVIVAAGVAAWRVQRLDPATVLREEV